MRASASAIAFLLVVLAPGAAFAETKLSVDPNKVDARDLKVDPNTAKMMAGAIGPLSCKLLGAGKEFGTIAFKNEGKNPVPAGQKLKYTIKGKLCPQVKPVTESIGTSSEVPPGGEGQLNSIMNPPACFNTCTIAAVK